jgi:SAM-dependent methyltransferase
MSYAILKLKKVTPVPIKSLFKALGFGKVLPLLKDKYAEELEFQMDWADEFVRTMPQTLEYWQKYRYLEEIRAICKFTETTRVLDVGCGISTVLHFVQGERHGIDPLAEDYKKLYAYPKEIDVGKAYGESVPFVDNYFDVVFCSNAIDHVTDPSKVIEEIHRVLKPGGFFVFTAEVFPDKRKRDPAHPHCLLRDDVYHLLGNGFKIILDKDSVWIGMRHYVHGSRRGDNREIITVSQAV